MSSSEQTITNRRQGRRWRFATAVFDEGSWTLTVDGGRVLIEPKPLEVLHELLLHAGKVVNKEDLLRAVWPGLLVVEASLSTAILKLRRALGDDDRIKPIIQTAPKVGYRLVVPVEMDVPGRPATGADHHADDHAPPAIRKSHRLASIGAMTVILGAAALGAAWPWRAPPSASATPIGRAETLAALRDLDVPAVRKMLAAGWNPNTPINREGDTAINQVLEICEWNPGQDRQRLLVMLMTLLDGGARLDHRNAFGDTAYSIAKAKRYCGPDHPATILLRNECIAIFKPDGGPCRAAYEPTKPL